MSTEETTKFNKSAFIRARPNLKPAEIIAEAEKLGQTISPGTIWTLRSADKRKAEGKVVKKAKAASGASKKVAKKANKKVAKKAKVAVKKAASAKPFNKSAFIRKYPKLGAGEVIEKAAAFGQTITAGMIYTLRSADKRAAEGGGASKKVSKVGKKTAKKASKKAARSERQLKVVTTPVGTDSPFKGGSVTGRPSIAFDPSDPAARKFIASALAANA
jgi:hypothetical protein